jgi:putative hydrolase of the HAD superfamily
MTSALFFDAAGTLFHLPRGVGHHYREVALRHGVDIPEAALTRAFSSAWRQAPPRPISRVPRVDDDRGWWREIVEQVLSHCAIGPGALDRSAYFAELYDEFTKPGVWQLYPEVMETLDALRTHYTLGVISNFDARLRTILDDLGIADRFSQIVISSEVGAEKPDPWIFQEALNRAQLLPEDAMHIGDDPVCDWQGAESAGMRVFRLERPRNSLRDLAKSLGGEIQPARRIRGRFAS